MKRLGIIVIFRERTGYVDECMRALAALEDGPWPVVLVPDRRVPAYDGAILQVPTMGGLSRKRNAGIAACPRECDLIAFVDSDAVPRPDWARRAVTAFERADEDIALMTGPNLTPPGDPWGRRACGYALESPLIMGGGARMYSGGGRPAVVGKAYSCNLVARRPELEAVNGFDESVRTEDVGLCEAILRRDRRILYEPELVVFHHRRDPVGFLLQWLNESLVVRDYFRYPNAGGVLVFFPSLLLLGEAALFAVAGGKPVLLLEGGMAVLFWLERTARTGKPLLSAGAAVAMAGFLKVYGLGSIASFFVWRPPFVASRRDPPPEMETGGGAFWVNNVGA